MIDVLSILHLFREARLDRNYIAVIIHLKEESVHFADKKFDIIQFRMQRCIEYNVMWDSPFAFEEWNLMHVFAYYYICRVRLNLYMPRIWLDLTRGLHANALKFLRCELTSFSACLLDRTSEGKSAKLFWQRDLTSFAFQRIKSAEP